MVKSSLNWVVYGSGLSALVLAERLASSGKKVVLLNPAKTWGGIFGGLKIGDLTFDGGMTNFEFDLFGEPENDIRKYSPDNKSDIGKYVHFVQDYIGRFAEIHKIPTPRMIHKEVFTADMIISNQFDVLKLLSHEEQNLIRSELEIIVNHPNQLHPKFKYNKDSLLEKFSFDVVSKANHGFTFHDLFIEPLFQKVLGISSAEVSGIFHRNGWAPLFYPETLLSQFSSSPQKLKPTIFHYPADPNFGAFIGRIVAHVQEMSNVQIFNMVKDVNVDALGKLISTDQGNFNYERLAWGGDLTQLHLTDEIPSTISPGRRSSLDIFFLEVDPSGIAEPFSVLIDPEKESPFYRVTNQTICHGLKSEKHQIILECNSKNWDEGNPDSQLILNASLKRYGIDPAYVTSNVHKNFTGALSIPSVKNWREFDLLRTGVTKKFPEIYLMGLSSGYVSVTLNDHIIQALKIAHLEGVIN
jgi:hypothetical protein